MVSVFLSIPLVFNNIQHPPGRRRERENGWRCALWIVEPTLFYAKQNSSRFFDQLKIMCHGFVFLNFSLISLFSLDSMALYSAARADFCSFFSLLFFSKRKKKIVIVPITWKYCLDCFWFFLLWLTSSNKLKTANISNAIICQKTKQKKKKKVAERRRERLFPRLRNCKIIDPIRLRAEEEEEEAGLTALRAKS